LDILLPGLHFYCLPLGWFGSYYGQKFDSGMLGGVLGAVIGGFLFGQVITAFARKHYRPVLLGKGAEQRATPHA